MDFKVVWGFFGGVGFVYFLGFLVSFPFFFKSAEQVEVRKLWSAEVSATVLNIKQSIWE